MRKRLLHMLPCLGFCMDLNRGLWAYLKHSKLQHLIPFPLTPAEALVDAAVKPGRVYVQCFQLHINAIERVNTPPEVRKAQATADCSRKKASKDGLQQGHLQTSVPHMQ